MWRDRRRDWRCERSRGRQREGRRTRAMREVGERSGEEGKRDREVQREGRGMEVGREEGQRKRGE